MFVVLHMQVELDVEVEKKANDQMAAFLEKLRELGVDSTQYVVAVQPEFTADKEIVVAPSVKV